MWGVFLIASLLPLAGARPDSSLQPLTVSVPPAPVPISVLPSVPVHPLSSTGRPGSPVRVSAGPGPFRTTGGGVVSILLRHVTTSPRGDNGSVTLQVGGVTNRDNVTQDAQIKSLTTARSASDPKIDEDVITPQQRSAIAKRYTFTAKGFMPVSHLKDYCLHNDKLPSAIPDKISNRVIYDKLFAQPYFNYPKSRDQHALHHAAIGLIFDKAENKFKWLDGKTPFVYSNFVDPKESENAAKRNETSYYVQVLHGKGDADGKWLYVDKDVYTTIFLCQR